MSLGFEPRHNPVAYLDDTSEQAAPFREMIAFLRRSRVYHAISDYTPAYKNLINAFWKNAIVVTVNNVIQLVSTVLDTQVIITEQSIRELLQLNDNPNMPVNFDPNFIAGAMQRIGYPGIPRDQYRKAKLTRVWRYLMHIFIVCFGTRKAGTDGMSRSLASAMLALVYNKDFNYSGFIFKAMVDNANAGDKKWLLYPRFIQLHINRHHPALAAQGDQNTILKISPMMNRIFTVCSAYEKGVQAPCDVPLFGVVLNANYVSPPDPQYMDSVAPQ